MTKINKGKVLPNINTKWFIDRLKEKEMSMRQLAKRMNLDPSAVSNMLNGKRMMRTEEANKIANLLGLDVREVIKQSGVPIEEGVRYVSVTLRAIENGEVENIPPETVRKYPAPNDVPFDAEAVQIRDNNSNLDGWIMYSGLVKKDFASSTGRLCVVTLQDSRRILGVLKRGYASNRWNIVPLTGGSVQTDVEVDHVSEIRWIRPTLD